MPTQFLASGASVVQWNVSRSPSAGLLEEVRVRALPAATVVLSAGAGPVRRGTVPDRARLVTEAGREEHPQLAVQLRAGSFIRRPATRA
ncbi:hypothetical protein GCM10010502_22220 [Kitasatospora aureofaciens]|uniref:Uncharacterized protein n=1 Tax=Kitasatospora aureofaciens TaxID=1894 RepID=A0A8H9LNQ0_KITAU|nr:hypothetical protein GCM10010502_22220 [Kitasatospora aureofaciens]